MAFMTPEEMSNAQRLIDMVKRQRAEAIKRIEPEPVEVKPESLPSGASACASAEAATATFQSRAMQTIAKGVPVIRIRPFTKIAQDNKWPDLATTDQDVIVRWNTETPNANCGAVAKAVIGGVWFFEVDSAEVVKRISADTGHTIPATWSVRSRPGRGHFYFKQTAESIQLGNVAQGYVKHGDFSVRVNNEYVVAAGSIRDDGKTKYEVVDTSEIVEAPLWLITWIKEQKVEKNKAGVVDDDSPIPDGKRNTVLASIAGRLRHAGASRQGIVDELRRINSARCIPPLPDEDIETIAGSIARYPVGKDEIPTIGGVPIGTAGPAKPVDAPVDVAPLDIDTTGMADRPVFPYWVIDGTTIGEGFVKPVVASSSKHVEFLFIPAVQMMLNCMFGQVRIKFQDVKLNMFVGLVSPRGKYFKSTSCELAHEYFELAGLSAPFIPSMDNANGKVIVTGVGSLEGFGKQMAKIHSSHAILYNDELSALVAKANIESSSYASGLLTLYGSGAFNNTVKSEKDSFAFQKNTYCFGWLWCDTDSGFNRHWPVLAGIASGLEDRSFFVINPPKETENVVIGSVNLQPGSIVTAKALDAACRQGVFDFEHGPALTAAVEGLDARSFELVQKLALYFAVDLGETEITNDCIERARALVDYRNAVTAYLAPIEALNQLARLQKEIRRELQRHRGLMRERDLCRNLHYQDYGTELWKLAFGGLVKVGDIVVLGSGKRADPKMVGLVKRPADDEVHP